MHRIVRQLTGGPQGTGNVLLCQLPLHLRMSRGVPYSHIFEYFLQSSLSGLCVGVFHHPSGDPETTLPVVITSPSAGFKVRSFKFL